MGFFLRAKRRYDKTLASLLEKHEEYADVTEIVDKMSEHYATMEGSFLDDETREKYNDQAQQNRENCDFNMVVAGGKTKSKSIIKKKHLSKMYRRIVEKTHPDKLERLEMSDGEKQDREYVFKDVVPAYKKLNIPVFFECANEVSVMPQHVGHYDFFSGALVIEIEILEEKIKILKETVAWSLYECQGDPACERALVQRTVNSIYK